MEWTANCILTINDTKKIILKKKVLLNIIIESYSAYDTIFRYIHLIIALASPFVGILNNVIPDGVENATNVMVVLSSIAASMIKIKEYLKFDKLKDLAKQQTVKYQQLFQRIEREMRKPTNSRQNEEDFISWITRELTIIEVDDPDISQTIRDKYIKLCKDRNIPYTDEDLDALGDLFKNTVSHEHKTLSITDAGIFQSPTDIVQSIPINQNIPLNQNVQSIPLSIPINQNIQKTLKRQRSPSVEADRQEYREKIKTLNTSKDLDWAMERLNDLQ